MRIAVYRDAGVIVTAPRRVSIATVAEFVRTKMAWIRRAARRLETNRREWVKPEHIEQESYSACRARAAKFIRARVQAHNTEYRHAFSRISVKNMTSRWGSCSQGKNLNFHYRLLFLPLALADYVVIHELCHLEELNHSKKFWRLVSRQCPNYRALRGELRNYSLL